MVRWRSIALVLLAGILPSANAEEQVPQGHALLVGVTKYTGRPLQPLVGPANDVALLRDVLLCHGFSAENIVTLAEDQPEVNRPTYDHIHREFLKLAEKAQANEQVVILLSGHGTQQPQRQPPDPNDPEPDGLDEVFLASDANYYDRAKKTIPGGIVDNDLGDWVRKIRDQGARVWIIVDSCHSGTILRGASTEIERRVPAEMLVPEEELAEARSHAVRTRGGSTVSDESQFSGDLKHIVAMYAAQPEESTIELALPPESDSPKLYGLLTYSLCRELSMVHSPITYRELAARVQNAYVRLGRTSPTPFLEGLDVGREVLGVQTWPERSRMLLARKENFWRVNVGAIHGLTTGTVLQVFPLAGTANADESQGYVSVTSLRPTECTVEPVAFGTREKVESLPDSARCELAYLDLHLEPLKVAVDLPSASEREQCTSQVKQVEQEERLLQSVPLAGADWVLRRSGEELVLEPASGVDARTAKTAPHFGPVPLPAGPWLREHGKQIARAQNLLRMARPDENAKVDKGPNVILTLLRLKNAADPSGSEIEWKPSGLVFHPGEWLGVRLKNQGANPVDVTLFFIDSGYGIQSVYPTPGTATTNRLMAEESQLAFRAQVNGTTTGLEHLVMIAVPGVGEPLDFSLLDQPTLPRTRSANGPKQLRSPFGELLKTAMYGQGMTRGESAKDLSQQCWGLISWRVEDEPEK
jgi:hypothetical protein